MPECGAGIIHVAISSVLLNHFECSFSQHACHDTYLAAATCLHPGLACCHVQAPEQAPGWAGLVTQTHNTKFARDVK